MLTYGFEFEVTNESFCLSKEKQIPGRIPPFFTFLPGSVVSTG